MQYSKRLQQQISQAISDIEQLTDAEVVCVLAPRSDDYYYIPALWAALLALVSPLLLVLTPWWGHSSTVSLLQLLVFVVSWLLFRWQPFFQHIIPQPVRYWRAANYLAVGQIYLRDAGALCGNPYRPGYRPKNSG